MCVCVCACVTERADEQPAGTHRHSWTDTQTHLVLASSLTHGLLCGETAQGAVLDGLLSDAFTAIFATLLILDGLNVSDIFQEVQGSKDPHPPVLFKRFHNMILVVCYFKVVFYLAWL